MPLSTHDLQSNPCSKSSASTKMNIIEHTITQVPQDPKQQLQQDPTLTPAKPSSSQLLNQAAVLNQVYIKTLRRLLILEPNKYALFILKTKMPRIQLQNTMSGCESSGKHTIPIQVCEGELQSKLSIPSQMTTEESKSTNPCIVHSNPS